MKWTSKQKLRFLKLEISKSNRFWKKVGIFSVIYPYPPLITIIDTFSFFVVDIFCTKQACSP